MYSFEDDMQWWQKPIHSQDAKNIWYGKPNTINVEMTAYGLLAYLHAGLYAEALPIMKWLLTQRNDLGGFQSTQDTFVGLEAILQYSKRITSNHNNVQATLSYNDGAELRMNINGYNSLVQQSFEVFLRRSKFFICHRSFE